MNLTHNLNIRLTISLIFCNFIFLYGQNLPSGMKIWFNQPASDWNDALPVGNGRLGAMVFGGVGNERLELNENSVWTGEPRWDANPDALKNLPKVRKLLFQAK